MDKTIEILLGGYKNINSINTDTFDKIELHNNESEIVEYDINDLLSANDVFDSERENNPIYRVYGKIEYMSLLNGLKTSYKNFEDFLSPTYDSNSGNVINSFDFYLVRPSDVGYTSVTGITTTSLIEPEIIVDEKFDNWVSGITSSYPFGWSIVTTTNSYAMQTITNQIKFVLDGLSDNSVTISKELVSIFGNIVFETNVTISPSQSTSDSLIVTLWSNDVILHSVDIISGGSGSKKYDYFVDSNNPLTKVTIVASGVSKNMYLDYFNLYRSGSTQSTQPISNKFIRYFKVIATPSDFEIFNAGFANNVYGEQAYTFSFKKDFDVSQYFDDMGFPLTELFLYPQYLKKTNGNNISETIKYIVWNKQGLVEKKIFTAVSLNIGDYVKSFGGDNIGDLIEYDKINFKQTQLSGQTLYITTQCIHEQYGSVNIVWKYNPFIPLRLRYFGNELYNVNTGSTSYDDVESIPEYATKLDDNGNYVWRNISPQGYTDPITEQGVNYPLLNKRRYLFNNIILSVTPDMLDLNTKKVFNDIWFTENASSINTRLKTNNDLSNIGKPCQ